MRHKDFLLVCPKCGSTNVSNDLSKDMIAWGGSTRYLCNDCDYSAIIFPEMKKSQISEFRSKISQSTSEKNEIIQKQNFSKGILNNNASKIPAYYILIVLSISLVWAFYEGYKNDNYFLTILSFLFLVVILYLLIKKK